VRVHHIISHWYTEVTSNMQLELHSEACVDSEVHENP
jgi:hypothetical protein